MVNRSIAKDGYKAWLDSGATPTRAALLVINRLKRKDAVVGGRSDGSGRMRTSSIGKCERMQALSFLGAIQNNMDRSLMVAGTWAHYRWQTAGLSQGFLTSVEAKARKRISGVAFGGNCDGILSDGTLLEFKSTMSFAFKHRVKAPAPGHVKQVNLYLGLLGLGIASLVYEDRNLMEVVEHEVRYDASQFDETVKRAIQVADMARSTDEIPEMDPGCTSTSLMRKGCQFRESCLSRWVEGR